MQGELAQGKVAKGNGSVWTESLDVEPFVDSDAVAQFLSVKRKTVLDWARKEIIPAHPFGRGSRTVWRFRISEIASHKKPARSTMGAGSPEKARLERKRG
jgi:hypothetical protein